MVYEHGHGVYESYPANHCYGEPDHCDEPCGYQPIVYPVAPPPIITEEHHHIEHDWECCYVYHRVLWILCIVLIIIIIGITFFCVISPKWIIGKDAPPRSPSYSESVDYYSTRVPIERAKRSPGSDYDADKDNGGGGDDYAGGEGDGMDVGWFKQCPPSGECIPHSIVHPSKLPWEIDIIKSITLRNLVPILFIIYFILFFTFILHLLVCYPTIDSLVFAFFMVAFMVYHTLVAVDVTNPHGKSVDYGIAFFLWMGALGCAALILIFIIIMCCTGCHF